MTIDIAFIFLLYLAAICLLLVFLTPILTHRWEYRRIHIKASCVIFASVFLLEAAAGYYIQHVQGMMIGDCLSRVANAFYVLNVQPAHLAAIGFVWPPLPSFMELPLVALAPVYKPIVTSGLAGVIVTSIFAAGTAVLLFKNFRHYNVPVWITAIILILYTFNPFIFVYGFNGMSEAIFIFIIVWTVTELLRWVDDGKPEHLMWIGVALPLAFLTRYEAVPFAAAVLLTIAFITIKNRHSKAIGKSMWNYFEGSTVVTFLPLATAALLWVITNWIIMGDPLYFLTSEYSNVTQSGQNLPAYIAAMMGNHGEVLLFIAKQSLPFVPLLAVVLLFRLFDRRLFRWETPALILLALSIPAMQYLMLMTGNSFGWLRFFLYPLPIAAVWLPYEFGKLAPGRTLFRNTAAVFCCIALIASGVLTWISAHDPESGKEEYAAYISETTGDDLDTQKEIAEYINENCSDGILLLDSFETFYIILNLDDTNNLITTASYTFTDALNDPAEFDVKYIVAVDPAGLGASDAINMRYSDLYENGADWCTLLMSFDGFRLFEVN